MEGDSSSSFRDGPHSLDELGECDNCRKTRPLAVTASGKYCWECIPPEDLGRLLRDLE